MVSKPSTGQPDLVFEPDPEFDQLLADVDNDPAALLVYEETFQRAKFLATGPVIRKSKKLSQKKLAARMGTTQSAVSDLESGRVEPQLRTLQRYARALGHRFDFGFVAQNLPISAEKPTIVQATALTPLLTALVRQPKNEAQTLQALADSSHLRTDMIGPLLNLLHDEGWTRSVGEGDERKYSFVPKFACVIGVSLERNRIVAELMTIDGDHIRSTIETLEDSKRTTVVPKVADIVSDLLASTRKPVLGVGVCVAGVVDSKSGNIKFAPDLEDAEDNWRGVEFRQELQAEIRSRGETADLRIAIENDANALAAYEYLKRHDDSVAVALFSGTGFGLGLVLEGRLIHGANSAAGESGHVLVDPAGPKCRAGFDHQGCLETMTSVQGMLTALGIPAETSEQRLHGLAVANRRIENGDLEAAKIFAEAGKTYGCFLASTVNLLDPQRMVTYASPYLAEENKYACGREFMNGVRAAEREASSSRLAVASEPRGEWHSLTKTVRARAAGAAGLWVFIKDAADWVPDLLAADAVSAGYTLV